MAAFAFCAALQSEGWARQDSNLGPRDYESPALTAELQARHALMGEHPTSNVQRPIFQLGKVLVTLRGFAERDFLAITKFPDSGSRATDLG